MNDMKNMLKTNLVALRRVKKLTQEEVAEKIGVSRQAVAKWESGDTMPDILNCQALADLYGVTVDDLVRYDQEEAGVLVPPRNKHLFGTVTIGERGQVVLPKKARDRLCMKPGDTLVVLGDTDAETQGLALVKSEIFMGRAELLMRELFPEEG